MLLSLWRTLNERSIMAFGGTLRRSQNQYRYVLFIYLQTVRGCENWICPPLFRSASSYRFLNPLFLVKTNGKVVHKGTPVYAAQGRLRRIGNPVERSFYMGKLSFPHSQARWYIFLAHDVMFHIWCSLDHSHSCLHCHDGSRHFATEKCAGLKIFNSIFFVTLKRDRFLTVVFGLCKRGNYSTQELGVGA